MEWTSWTITALAEEKDVKSHILDMYQTPWLHDMFVCNIYVKKKKEEEEVVSYLRKPSFLLCLSFCEVK